MYNQENINKSIELIDSMINVMVQQEGIESIKDLQKSIYELQSNLY